MAFGPPPVLVTFVERLIPPDAREVVLGDLWERYSSPMRFAGQAFAVLPFLIVSQVRRRSSWPVLGLQAFVLFACLRGFVPSDVTPPQWARAGFPTLFVFVALAWYDAYRSSDPRSLLRQCCGEAGAAIVGVALSQVLIICLGLSQSWQLGPGELLFASSALPVLCVFRIRPSGADLWQANGSHSPAGPQTIATEYDQFRQSVRRRNRLDSGAMLTILLIILVILTRLDGPIGPSIAITILGFCGFTLFLFWKGNAPEAETGAEQDDVARLLCTELSRQHRIRSFVVWWWLTPLFLGLAMHFLSYERSFDATRSLVGILLMLMLGICIHVFNLERRSLIQCRINQIERQSA